MHPPRRKSCKAAYAPVPTEVEIRDSQVESGQSRLTLDSWTLCKSFREVRAHASPEKIRNLRSSNCWKCIQIVNATATTLFLYHFKSFTIPSGGPFWLFGGGGACAPRAPPAYGPVATNSWIMRRLNILVWKISLNMLCINSVYHCMLVCSH